MKVYVTKNSPTSSHGILLDEITARSPKTMLDLGCADGSFSHRFVRQGVEVHGLDKFENMAARANLTTFVVKDLENSVVGMFPHNFFDLILMADVLEHLSDPAALLRSALDWLRPQGRVLVSLPNMGHWYPRFRVLFGLWAYEEYGILDSTHLRFFSIRSAIELCEKSGYFVEYIRYSTSPWELLSERTAIQRMLTRIDGHLVRMRPPLFAYQAILTLKKPSKSQSL